MTALLATAIHTALWLPNKVAGWWLETHLDPAVCRLSNELGGED